MFNTDVRRAFLLLAVVAGMICTGFAAGLGSSEWASWVQAVGSVAAIIGAIFIASSDSRHRRREVYSVALIGASEMHFAITMMRRDIQDLANELGAADMVDFSLSQLNMVITALNAQSNWTSEQISVLAPLPNNCALHIAMAQGRITAIKILLEKAMGNSGLLSNKAFRVKHAEIASFALNEAAGFLKKAEQEIQLQTHGLSSPNVI